MKDLFVITHTESEHHVKKLGGGWYDTPLTKKGEEDAERIAVRLFDRLGKPGIPIFSSDLKRCSGMANIFKRVFSSSIQLDSRLREMSYGAAEGKSVQWQEAHIRPTPDGGDRLDHRVFEGAESRREIGMRMTNFVEEVNRVEDQQAIVITHGFALTFLIAAWLKVPFQHMDFCEFRSSPGGVTHLSANKLFENRSLVGLNDKSFVRSWEEK